MIVNLKKIHSCIFILDISYQNRYIMTAKKQIFVFFFVNDRGKEPVREWLKGLSKEERTIIGEDIKTAEFSWPIGMPTVGTLGSGLYEVRSNLPNKTIARTIFTIYKRKMVLLHGFIKKDQKTPNKDKKLAKQRLKKFESKK